MQQGELFIALQGEHFDAHEFIAEAAASGATGEAADAAVARAWFGLSGALAREGDALRSIHDIHSGSSQATEAVEELAVTMLPDVSWLSGLIVKVAT